MFLIESALLVATVLLAFIRPTLGARWFETAERKFSALGRHRLLSVLVVGLTVLAVRTALLPVLPIPQPANPDEFGYLLTADTFAHGRLVEPTHPMWIHFESFHINQTPTYSSMFYPAQALALGLGQVMWRQAWLGVWLGLAAMCASLCWMLQEWVGPEWALLGGLLVVIRLGTFSYWANSYNGGAIAATGGALVLGALPRIWCSPRVRYTLMMGLGLAILAASRPYEGLFLSLPVAGALLVWMLGKKGPSIGLSLRRIVVPLALILGVATVAMFYYCWRTTGTPFRTPYLANVATYNPVPYFPWQPLKPVPEYHHAVMKNFYLNLVHVYQFAREHPGWLIATKAVNLWLFFLGPLLFLPLMICAILWHRSPHADIGLETRFLLLVGLVFLLGTALPIYFFPHYAAPLTSAIYALVLLALRRVRHWQWNSQPTGLFITRAVPVIAVTMLVLGVAAPVLHVPFPKPWPTRPASWCSPEVQLLDRARVQARLEGQQGRHLVIVRYERDHDPVREWVYNEADIDASKVVWARDMSPAENQELINYFKDRQVWLLEADEKPPRLSPYPLSEAKLRTLP